MPLTEDQKKLNLQTLIGNVKAELGLSASPLKWSYEERYAYTQRLAAGILQYPNSLPDTVVTAANAIYGKPLSELQNTGFDYAEFFEESAGTGNSIYAKTLKVVLIGGAIYGAVKLLPYVLKKRG